MQTAIPCLIASTLKTTRAHSPSASNPCRPASGPRMMLANPPGGDLHDHFGHLIDCHHSFRTNIYRPAKTAVHQSANRLDAFIYIKEGARLLAITPNLNHAAIFLLGHFSAKCSWSLFSPALPCA